MSITTDLTDLRDTEQRVLNYMLISNDNFLMIINKLSPDDFVFSIHKVLFENLIIHKEIFLSTSFHGVALSINTKLLVFALSLHINKNTTMDIFSQAPSLYIESDLETLNENNMKRECALYNNKKRVDGLIETRDGLTSFIFINDALISVETTNISHLPQELHTSVVGTLKLISKLDLEDEDNKFTLGFNDNGAVVTIYMKKDIEYLKWFDRIRMWADKYKLDTVAFPRDMYKLQNLEELDISHRGIKELPKDINKLYSLEELIINDNNIKELPESLYELNNLRTLCLHSNNLKTLSSKIGNLSQLEKLTISNTNIEAVPMALLRSGHLNHLSINDALLPLIIKNIKYLDLDTINVTASKFSASSQIIKELNLRIDTEAWIQDKDKKENGCIVLTKYDEEK